MSIDRYTLILDDIQKSLVQEFFQSYTDLGEEGEVNFDQSLDHILEWYFETTSRSFLIL